jgi:Domain of unknown function (DUF4397)
LHAQSLNFDTLEHATMTVAGPIRWSVARLLVAAGTVTLLSGCQGLQPGSSSTAQLRVIDASPDAGSVDSYTNGSGLAYNLEFGMVTTYVPTPPGGMTLTATRSGTRQALATNSVTLTPGRQYTAIVGNIAADMQQTLYVDQMQPAAAGEIAVRLIDQVTRGGAVDVYLVPGTGKLAFTTPVATNLKLGENSGYVTMPAGTYALVVVPAGTTPSSTSGALLSGAQVSYASGAVRTVVLIDSSLAARPFADAHPFPSATVLTPAVQAIIAVDADAN